ncbi:S8 family peptidase [Anaerocolumna sp. MB42-C2]|uniref:S8 family peptidase n=1 Tax=Anaerocolumna sp. MB42-C2 TaxID=3070997 RepID=UPI0027DFC1CF|nr:S8 family peptidase [Anaerocolumna sp. MB42-C2]WMJ86646.1 S8 family peptidase [Anaerocolumna sp. MB42-C2]
MTQEEKYKIISNDYTDLFLVYNRNEKLLYRFPDSTPHIFNTRYAIGYTPADILNQNFIGQYGYIPLPHLYGLTSEISLDASEVRKLRQLPRFNLRGKGVLVALIDTGIDYTNPIFRHQDGSSKIAALWDQTIDSSDQYPANTFYGTEYNNEQINLALRSNNPMDIVPSTDEIGHGTMLAGIMVGSEVQESEFSGVVPDADIIIVKLKQAKQNLKDFFIISPDVPCYQENDIMWAYQYIMETALKLKRPCAVCIGLGSSQGSHDGKGPLNNMLDFFADFTGFTYSVSAGNEGNMKRHFYSEIDPSTRNSVVEMYVGEGELGFSMEIWGNAPNTYSIDIMSPTGEYIPRIAESLRTNQEIRFIFEKTLISVNYRLAETYTGEQLILLRFLKPTPGIWRIQVYSRGDLPGSYHIWLPMNGFISANTYFLSPDPYTTITSPGNTSTPLTMTAYNPANNALYENASYGYSRNGYINPDLAAPGVGIIVPDLLKGFTTASGTGLAAAHTAGITAIMLEWGIVNGFYPSMNSTVVKKYLIRGAKRSKVLSYPNPGWGYGIIDLYNVFNIFRSDFPRQ